MQESENISKLKKILKRNGGYITRRQVDAENISSWFLTDFVRKENLEKIAAGFYAKNDWMQDDFLVFQYKYPKFIFSFDSALYLLNLTDNLPQAFEVTGPKNYRPFSPKENLAIIHTESKLEIYGLGISETETNLGNSVRSYNMEKTICDLISRSDKIDSETYTKALHNYARRSHNSTRLLEYAKVMGIEKKVYETMLVVVNEQ